MASTDETKRAIAEALQQQDEPLLKSSKATGDATPSSEEGAPDLPPRLMLSEVMDWPLTSDLRQTIVRTPLNDTLALHGPRWQLRIGDLLYGIVMQAVGLSNRG